MTEVISPVCTQGPSANFLRSLRAAVRRHVQCTSSVSSLEMNMENGGQREISRPSVVRDDCRLPVRKQRKPVASRGGSRFYLLKTKPRQIFATYVIVWRFLGDGSLGVSRVIYKLSLGIACAFMRQPMRGPRVDARSRPPLRPKSTVKVNLLVK